MMNKDIKDKWVTALRSGNYKQGRNALRVEIYSKQVSFCCLGVLCEIQGLAQTKGIESTTFFTYQGRSSRTTLPGMFGEEIGVSAEIQSNLANMNDEGKTFEQIAEWIEGNL